MSSGDPTNPVSTPEPTSAPTASSTANPISKAQGKEDVSSFKPKGILQLIVEYLLTPIDKNMLMVAPEIGHLSPVIFTLGSLFLSIVTLNYPIFLFSLASGEASLIHTAISAISSYFITPLIGTMTEKKRDSQECKSYFQGITPMRFTAFLQKGLANDFPSAPLYYISFAAAYCMQCISVFSEECSELGPAYSNRAYIALMGGVMFILLYALYIVTYGCDTMITVICSIFIGGIVGSFLCYQNYLLFGKSGVDLLFIPPLQKRTGMDYICVSTS
jgi:hypothetical protein